MKSFIDLKKRILTVSFECNYNQEGQLTANHRAVTYFSLYTFIKCFTADFDSADRSFLYL